jgi:hypothetical protein
MQLEQKGKRCPGIQAAATQAFPYRRNAACAAASRAIGTR